MDNTMSNEYEEVETLETPEDKTEENGISQEEFELLDEKTQKTIQTLQAQKEHWRKKATAEPKPKEETPEPLQEENQSPEPDVKQLLGEQEERVDLRLQGYSVDEINFASRNRQSGQSLSEAIKSDFVAAGIEATRNKVKADDGTPTPTNRSQRYNGKTYEDIVRDGSPEEKQAALEQIVRGVGSNQSE